VPLHTIRGWLGPTSIAQTSTYLAGTIRTQHDAMTQFEARRGSVQQHATNSKTGGRKRPKADRKSNKTWVDRDLTVL
jgi:hypothetical protein